MKIIEIIKKTMALLEENEWIREEFFATEDEDPITNPFTDNQPKPERFSLAGALTYTYIKEEGIKINCDTDIIAIYENEELLKTIRRILLKGNEGLHIYNYRDELALTLIDDELICETWDAVTILHNGLHYLNQ